jgi:transcriptional regulator with XRE-family HTH domain
MSTPNPLFDTVLQAAQAQGLDQARLARRAGLRAETVSRAKHRGTIDLSSLQALAQAVGLELTLKPATGPTALPPQPERSSARRSPLADPKWGLAWSNPDASAEVLVRNALAHGNFDLLLQAVLGHGLAFVKTQWRQVSPTLPTRARQEVERKLNNIEQGLNDAAA